MGTVHAGGCRIQIPRSVEAAHQPGHGRARFDARCLFARRCHEFQQAAGRLPHRPRPIRKVARRKRQTAEDGRCCQVRSLFRVEVALRSLLQPLQPVLLRLCAVRRRVRPRRVVVDRLVPTVSPGVDLVALVYVRTPHVRAGRPHVHLGPAAGDEPLFVGRLHRLGRACCSALVLESVHGWASATSWPRSSASPRC